VATHFPSIRLLFSQLSTPRSFLLLLPAAFTSILSGAIAPSIRFNVFAQFPLNPNPPQSATTALLYNVKIAVLELLAFSFGSFTLASLTSRLWIWTGEHNVTCASVFTELLPRRWFGPTPRSAPKVLSNQLMANKAPRRRRWSHVFDILQLHYLPRLHTFLGSNTLASSPLRVSPSLPRPRLFLIPLPT
jgi:hypothetical protein